MFVSAVSVLFTLFAYLGGCRFEVPSEIVLPSMTACHLWPIEVARIFSFLQKFRELVLVVNTVDVALAPSTCCIVYRYEQACEVILVITNAGEDVDEGKVTLV